MNLLFVNPTFRKWGGVEEVVLVLANHFRRLGHRIVIASDDTPATLEGRFAPDFAHYPLPLKRKTPLQIGRNAWALLQIARHERIDLIHSHQKKTTLASLIVGRLLGIPVVHTHHNPLGDWRARWFGLFGRHVIANSASTRDNLIRMFGVRAERITVIYDAPRFLPVPAPEEVARVRAEFGIVPGQPVLVSLGRLTEEKGHAVLLRAMPRVRAEFPGVRLLIVGKGHVRRRLQDDAAALGLTETVTFTGYREDANAIICTANLAVHPSLTDAMPLTNMECLRLGVPVVTTAVGGIPELIRDGETGILVPPNDPLALAKAVCATLRDPAGARAIAERGREDVLARFDPVRMCDRYEAYFAAILRRSVRPELHAHAEDSPAHVSARGRQG